MTENEGNGRGIRNLLRLVCFMTIGICAFSNPLDQGNLYNIGFGIITGLLFGVFIPEISKGFF